MEYLASAAMAVFGSKRSFPAKPVFHLAAVTLAFVLLVEQRISVGNSIRRLLLPVCVFRITGSHVIR
jgi:hypothetical protein